MPGIVGIIELDKLKKGKFHPQNELEAISSQLLHYEWYKTQFFESDGIRVQGIITGLTQENCIKEYDDGITIVIIGELYNTESYESNYFDYIKEKYLLKQDDFLSELNGTFSLLIHDYNKKKTIIAVDRVASKPVYYYTINDKLFISPEFKSFSQIDNQLFEIEKSAMADILTHGFVLNNKTLLKNIFELPNGHMIKVDNGKIEIKQYWDFNFKEEDKKHSYSYYANRLEELLEKAIKRRIRQNIASGILLSGGIDCRAILGYMSKYVSNPITICYGHKRNNWSNSDSDIAEKLAKHYHSDHYFLEYSLDNYLETINKVSHISDGLARPLPEFEVYKKIRRELGISRVFTGDHAFGRWGKFMGDDEQMLDFGIYIRFFCRYKMQFMPVNNNWYKELLKESTTNINDLLNKCSLSKIKNRRDYFYLNAYQVPLLGRDRSTIMSELEVINPWYDSEILDFVKTMPEKYRKDKKLFKSIVKKTFKEINYIELARTVSKPPQEEWEKWYQQNVETIMSDLKVSELVTNNIIQLSKLENQINKPIKENTKKKHFIKLIKNNLPSRSRYNWINTSSPKYFHLLLISIHKIASNFINYLIYIKIKKQEMLKLNVHTNLINVLRLHTSLQVFNLKKK
ncbi:hypothetical protein EB822_10720 [Flavobacteriaceae bacterium PRS1]|nr:hypothetical protein EB822_10720 [Flavobacteriaceae bacterium PRS1]